MQYKSYCRVNMVAADDRATGRRQGVCLHHVDLYMMTSSNGNLSALLAHCAGNSPITGEFPAQRPVTRSFDILLIFVWRNDWVNNHEAGDLRRHRSHYDVTVMVSRRI